METNSRLVPVEQYFFPAFNSSCFPCPTPWEVRSYSQYVGHDRGDANRMKKKESAFCVLFHCWLPTHYGPELGEVEALTLNEIGLLVVTFKHTLITKASLFEAIRTWLEYMTWHVLIWGQSDNLWGLPYRWPKVVRISLLSPGWMVMQRRLWEKNSI